LTSKYETNPSRHSVGAKSQGSSPIEIFYRIWYFCA